MPATSPGGETTRAADEPSRLGKFIQTYHSFLSTFVIGAAGLVATSIWQYKQSEITRRQAESEQHIAATQAENSWRIERAEILSKNLQVLASSGEATVEQRYGVLLSLTRGRILDPELAVSYALELGKDNADYMKSVLATIPDKSFQRLAGAFELTCAQRFGVTRDAPICKSDALADRSSSLAELIGDEIDSAAKQRKPSPTALLADERDVQSSPARLSRLFAPYLDVLYERRQWPEIDRFEALSVGARLVSALALGPARDDELVAGSEKEQVAKFHDARMKWLLGYVLATSCDGQCKARIVDEMLSASARSHGHSNEMLRALLQRPRIEVAPVLSRLHSRLLACQVDAEVSETLRDAVLVPALADETKQAKGDTTRLEDLLGLLALLPEPAASDEDGDPTAAHAAWQATLQQAREAGNERFAREFSTPRAAAAVTRKKPPPTLRKAMLCSAAEVAAADTDLAED